MGIKKLSQYLYIVTTVISIFALFSSTTPAYATSNDETMMSAVADQVDDLWTFVDNSGQTPDEQFYPAFAKRADTAHQEISKAYDSLGNSTETHQTKQSIEDIRADIQTMLKQITAWRLAATKADAAAFQTASDNLSTTVTTYNADVTTYNLNAYGSRATLSVALYAGSFGAAFSLCAGLFALAVFRNAKNTHDVAQEISRRLRWHMAYASIIILLGTAMPFYLFFFTNSIPMWWTWLLAWIGIGLVGLALFRTLRVRQFVKATGLK